MSPAAVQNEIGEKWRPAPLDAVKKAAPGYKEVAMVTDRVAAFVALFCLIAGGASAATATGRITYLAPDRHQLILDNSDMYAVGPTVDMSSVAIADRIRINWDQKGGEDVITSLVKVPLTPAAAG